MPPSTRPQAATYVSRNSDINIAVSRQSGLVSTCGTFGKKTRFSADRLLSDEGVHSPWGNAYYKNATGKDSHGSKAAGMGFGSRPPYVKGMPHIGPGSYSPITSAAKPASQLDGKKYCTLTIKGRQKVVVGAVSPHEEALKPGPGTYTLPSEVCGEYVNRNGRKNWVGPKAPKMGIQLPSKMSSTCNDIMYDVSTKLGTNGRMAFNDPKKSSTFGFTKTKNDNSDSQSPAGNLYYSHVKLTTDYSKVAKASGMGSGERPPLLRAQHNLSPVSYQPMTSAAKQTSSIDGFAARHLSPITQFGGISSLKRRAQVEENSRSKSTS